MIAFLSNLGGLSDLFIMAIAFVFSCVFLAVVLGICLRILKWFLK